MPRTPRRKLTLEERFWPHVNKTETCWLWTAEIMNHGHGRIGHWPTRKQRILAHRASWLIHFGPIPEGMFVCHKCDVRACVRPDHLFLGTAKDNLHDAALKGRMRRGEKHLSNKLKESDVLRIRFLYPARSQQSIADEYGVSQVAISALLRGKSWAWLKTDSLPQSPANSPS